ncbi:cardiolipin synthase [Prevotella sp. E2-28]|uniref:cardiolipin synthase n=1 Tax=Prevotella sp. E2-28 TaxID=2913620 RepID=UPI001EDC7C2B|nr:cardiolipin synthase [Prevotella sp. E2-28]UKK54321.1 cardiolipin synthase [Prevotella sp. E2-28]
MSWQTLVFIIYQVIVITAILHVVLDNRQPAKTMAWVMVIYFVPVVGVVAYLFLGANTRRERMVSQRSMDQLTRRSMSGFVEQGDLQLPEVNRPVIDLFVNQSFSLPFNNNKVEILTDGYEFFPSLLHDIASAQSHIHVDVYIFEDDALGRLISDALIAKARRGVEIRVLYDDVGCWSVPTHFFERMRLEGIEVEPFMPVRFPTFARKMNYRNHRKLFIIDGKVGYIGGMNFALRYVKGRHNRGWRDTVLRIEGSGVYSLQRSFLIDWYFVDRTQLSDKKYYPKFDEEPHGALLQTVTSAPLAAYPEIMQGYVRIILSAKKYIYIQSPYFLPTEIVFFALKTAVASGVDVRVMVPRKTDGWFVEWGSRSYLREAQEAGIRILLYEPRFLHAKMLVCDDNICTCGSTNIDFRSFLNNFEANTFVYDEAVALRMKHIFLHDEELSTPLVSLPKRIHPSFLTRLGESVMRLLSPLL